MVDKTSVKVLPNNICPPKSLRKLNDDVLKKQAYEAVSVDRQTAKSVISLSKS